MPPSSRRKRRQMQIVAIVVATAMVLSLLVSFIQVMTSEPESVRPGDEASMLLTVTSVNPL